MTHTHKHKQCFYFELESLSKNVMKGTIMVTGQWALQSEVRVTQIFAVACWNLSQSKRKGQDEIIVHLFIYTSIKIDQKMSTLRVRPACVTVHGALCLLKILIKIENLLQEIKVSDIGRDNDFMYCQELDVFCPTPTSACEVNTWSCHQQSQYKFSIEFNDRRSILRVSKLFSILYN